MMPARLMLACIVFVTLSFMLLTRLCMWHGTCAANSCVKLAEHTLLLG